MTKVKLIKTTSPLLSQLPPHRRHSWIRGRSFHSIKPDLTYGPDRMDEQDPPDVHSTLLALKKRL
jgi:hypothetical protein